MMQSVMLMATNNLECSPGLANQSLCYNGCGCDGVFSEYAPCRVEIKYQPLNEICPQPKYTIGPYYNLIPLCSDDPRPRLFFMQCGIHYHTKFNTAFNYCVDGWIQRVRSLRKACKNTASFSRVYLVYSGVGAQSARLDKEYPHQSTDRAIQFNELITKAILPSNVHVLDFINLTMNARSTDGTHSVTDVNLYKANTFLHLIKALSEDVEGKFAFKLQ